MAIINGPTKKKTSIPDDYGTAFEKCIKIGTKANQWRDLNPGMIAFNEIFFEFNYSSRKPQASILPIFLNRLRILSKLDKAESIIKSQSAWKEGRKEGIEYLFKYLGLRYTTPMLKGEDGVVDISKSVPYMENPSEIYMESSIMKTRRDLGMYSSNSDTSVNNVYAIDIPHAKKKLIGEAFLYLAEKVYTSSLFTTNERYQWKGNLIYAGTGMLDPQKVISIQILNRMSQ